MANGSLTNAVAIVTGGASGIGFATVQLLVENGAMVLVVDRDKAQLTHAMELLEDDSAEHSVGWLADVADVTSVKETVVEARRRFGRIDILVNNAGINPVGTVIESTPEEWDRVFAVNVRSVYLLSRLIIPIMREQGGGQIVNTASEVGLVGAVGFAAYSASKAAVINLTKSMAIDHAAEGIRVNCVCPGPIETPLLQRFYDAQDDPAGMRLLEEQSHPLGIGSPRDVAEAIVFLGGPHSRYITGHALAVDGGFTAM